MSGHIHLQLSECQSQGTSLAMLLLVKPSLANDGGVLVMKESCSVVVKTAGLTVATIMMLEYFVTVRYNIMHMDYIWY